MSWQPAAAGGALVDPAAVARLPRWLAPVADLVSSVEAEQLSRFLPPDEHDGREGAVLVLFGEGDRGPDVLLIERAHDMRSHAGQPAFPGGAIDPGDDGAVAAALREAQEETGLDPAGVEPFATLPPLWLPPSNFVVTPVLGWWREPTPVRAADPREVASVVRAPVADLVDPELRVRVRHPSGYVGPGFVVGDLLVWGFTGGLLATLLQLVGWERPWEPGRVVDLPATGAGAS